MPLIYAFVARRTTVLAEYTSYSGNFSTIAIQVRGRDATRARRWENSARGNGACPRVRGGQRARERERRGSEDAGAAMLTDARDVARSS